MTKDEAHQEAARLGREHPDRAAWQWLARERDDGAWVVVRVPALPGGRNEPLTTTEGAHERPPYPDDPRPPIDPGIAGPLGF